MGGNNSRYIDGGMYSEYNIDGFDYRVEPVSPEQDQRTAEILHDLNRIAILAIGHIRKMVEAIERGEELESEDKWIDSNKLVSMYGRLRVGYNAEQMYETLSHHDGSSYVINQGEEIHMCVRRDGDYDNRAVLLTVLSHELSHVASSTPDHDPEFWDTYKVMQHVFSRMGLFSASDIPAGGGYHCKRIRIGEREIRSAAAKYQPIREPTEYPSPYLPEPVQLNKTPMSISVFQKKYNGSRFTAIDRGESLHTSYPVTAYYSKSG